MEGNAGKWREMARKRGETAGNAGKRGEMAGKRGEMDGNGAKRPGTCVFVCKNTPKLRVKYT